MIGVGIRFLSRWAKNKSAGQIGKETAVRIKLDCNACTATQSMIPTRIPKFSTILRIIGIIIIIPSVIGLLFAVVMFFATGHAATEVMLTAKKIAAVVGASVGVAMGFGAALVIGSCSLAGGVVGWLLCMKKKVYLCRTCGCTIKRA